MKRVEAWRAENRRWYMHVNYGNGKVGDSNSYKYKWSVKRKAKKDHPSIPLVFK